MDVDEQGIALIAFNLQPKLIHLVAGAMSSKAAWDELECFYRSQAKHYRIALNQIVWLAVQQG